MSQRYILRTLGCKANLYDSQLIERDLQNQGWEPHGEAQGEVSLCVINSCTVTDEADKQTRKMAARLSRENPNAVVVVTGCGAEVNPEGFAKSPGVHFVVGNQNKNELVDLVRDQIEKKALNTSSITSDILEPQNVLGTTKTYGTLPSKHEKNRPWKTAEESFETPPVRLKGQTAKTRSFLKIQEGCNSFCTYCIIPYGRGPNRSLRPKDILNQIRELVQQGVKEVILTGTNIGDYGTDWDSKAALDDLIEMILNETDLPRLRVSSLDPTEITPKILKLMAESPRFCPHFHVSLQSPHDRILKLMKRKYGFAQVKECLETIARYSSQRLSPVGGIFVGMDIITGFPGETDEEFEWTYQRLSELPWNRLHVFPYSERSGTPATRLPHSVPQSKRVQRARRLTELSMKRLESYHRTVLKTCMETGAAIEGVLIEKKGESSWTAGYSQSYIRVLLPENASVSQNQLVSVLPIELMIDSKNNDVAFVSKLLS